MGSAHANHRHRCRRLIISFFKRRRPTGTVKLGWQGEYALFNRPDRRRPAAGTDRIDDGKNVILSDCPPRSSCPEAQNTVEPEFWKKKKLEQMSAAEWGIVVRRLRQVLPQ